MARTNRVYRSSQGIIVVWVMMFVGIGLTPLLPNQNEDILLPRLPQLLIYKQLPAFDIAVVFAFHVLSTFVFSMYLRHASAAIVGRLRRKNAKDDPKPRFRFRLRDLLLLMIAVAMLCLVVFLSGQKFRQSPSESGSGTRQEFRSPTESLRDFRYVGVRRRR